MKKEKKKVTRHPGLCRLIGVKEWGGLTDQESALQRALRFTNKTDKTKGFQR